MALPPLGKNQTSAVQIVEARHSTARLTGRVSKAITGDDMYCGASQCHHGDEIGFRLETVDREGQSIVSCPGFKITGKRGSPYIAVLQISQYVF